STSTRFPYAISELNLAISTYLHTRSCRYSPAYIMLLFNTIVTVLGLSAVCAAPLNKRDAATVLSDLSAIGTDVSTLDSDVNDFNGSILQAFPLQTAESNLVSAINTATSDTTSSSAFSTTDSTNIVNATEALTPLIVKVLNDLVGKVS